MAQTVVNIQVIQSAVIYDTDGTTVKGISYTMKLLPPGAGDAIDNGSLQLTYVPPVQLPAGSEYQLTITTP